MVRLLPALLVGSLLLVPAAHAKEFKPGDLRVCNAKRCVAVTDRQVLRQLVAFYYSGGSPKVAESPRMGTSLFQLRFRNGYVTGVVGSARLDRFLSYGVHDGHFRQGVWYRVPARAAQELRELTAQLTPLRLTPSALRRSR